MEGLGHLVEAIDDQVNLAPLDIEKTDIRWRHHIEGQTRCLFPQPLQDPGEQCGLGIVRGHNPNNMVGSARIEI